MMNDTRREFLKKAGLLTGAAGLFSVLPASIQQALAIDAAPGSTYLDAEHVVFLMQENRSFDHCFGTLQGVRGFNDPRAIKLADQNPVWLQSNKAGHTYAPFRLNIKDTKATWMNSLPHSWENQVDARNGGKYDKWLDSKKSGNPDFAAMPLTMGYYNREDIPFYYALADSFTVCDQHFSSSLTGTSPNRLFFFSGTVREEQNEKSKAHVWNDEIDHKDVHWTTFPERLEELGISWKAYQNELSIPVGFEGEEEDWLANFTDNDLEFFKQFNVRLHGKHLDFMEKYASKLQEEIVLLNAKLKDAGTTTNATIAQTLTAELEKKQALLKKVKEDQKIWNKDRFDKLSEREKSIHRRAFTTNDGDPDYHKLVTMTYDDVHGTEREVQIPKGDTLYQFRKDVQSGRLPAVSWLVAPCHFSDHPGSPWYGAWYISEVLDILTKNQEIWKKTIFILTYDENDGYFDHVPPFLPPHTEKPESGKSSAGVDTRVEYVSMEQEHERGFGKERQRASAIGLGYRVPMVVMSPWSKGGWVNSQVFDHTSNLQFLEHWLSKKTGKKVEQPQISDWRRTVCGDLTSVFRPSSPEKEKYPETVGKDEWIQRIHQAKFMGLPDDFHALSTAEIEEVKTKPLTTSLLPQQERGIRPSSAIPYQLYVSGKYNAKTKALDLLFESRKNVFGDKTAGVPFTAYLPGQTNLGAGATEWDAMRSLHYAVKAGDVVQDKLELRRFKDQQYHVQVLGPNGFLREFKGNDKDPELTLNCGYQRHPTSKNKISGNIELNIVHAGEALDLLISDHAYGRPVQSLRISQQTTAVVLETRLQFGWYDFSVSIKGNPTYERRFAGRVETGAHSKSDPFMGRTMPSGQSGK